MHCSIVILNWNGRKHLQTCLPSVCATDYEDYSIWVADNGSTDDSVAWLREQMSDCVQILELKDNTGYAGGYAKALQQIKADVYVLLNSDVEVTPSWLRPVMSAFATHQKLAAVQPHILDYRNRNMFEYAGAAGGYIDFLGYPFCAGRIFEQIEDDHGQYNSPKSVFWVSGACLFVRAGAYHQVGGLDPTFFAHMEEIDLCWRLQNAGYQLWQMPESVVYHIGGGTLSYGNSMKTFLNFRNSLINLQKNLPANERYWKVTLRMLLDLPAALKFLFHGSWADAWAVFRAHMSFYRLQPTIRRTRKAIINRPLPSAALTGMFRGSILWVHVSGRKDGLNAFFYRQLLKDVTKGLVVPVDMTPNQTR
ncbi:MAG: glycosyltransferase family 2 protein [Sphingomonadales bacterium]|nr:glycosyltransferase family 2 protein [Sphingomonadales bacterium]